MDGSQTTPAEVREEIVQLYLNGLSFSEIDSVAVTPQDSLISLGTSFSLTCTLSPVVTDHSNVRWTLERASNPTNSQVTLTNSGRFTISTRTDSEAGQTVSVLTISEVETDDSGEYYCSDQTDMNQNQATLTVYTAPRVELISDPAVPIVDK
ncbi:Ig kappa chain V-III region PC 4050-like [Ptychodera flava]|uniref:Ig kappa chain V-III region PC 4050-like n=1 Tax=Ptychodera flava TaxID=63121 RepID=UPI00396A2D2B